MKCLYALVVLWASACIAGAGEVSIPVEDTSSAGAVAASSLPVRGLLDSIVVDVAASTTNGIVVASGDETLFTVSGVTADTVYRPRVVGVTTTNGAWGAEAAIERIYLSGEKLTVTVTATQAAVEDVSVKIKFIDK